MSTHLEEFVHARIMEAVAQGGTVAETRRWLEDQSVEAVEVTDTALRDGLSDALSYGIEWDDIDPSWKRYR